MPGDRVLADHERRRDLAEDHDRRQDEEQLVAQRPRGDPPDDGELALRGKNLKPQRLVGAKPVSGPGTYKLLVKPKGKLKKKLKKKGKAKAKPTITFTPTGGLPATQQTKVKLKRKVKR